jgi:hypothetical protein
MRKEEDELLRKPLIAETMNNAEYKVRFTRATPRLGSRQSLNPVDTANHYVRALF